MKNVIIIVLLSSFHAQAQYNTNIQMQLGHFVSPQNLDGTQKGIFNNVGGAISYKISNKLGIKISGHTWYRLNISPDKYYHQKDIYQDEFLHFDSSALGKTAVRNSYTIFDFMPVYYYRMYNHELSLGVGLSYAYGKNSVLSSLFSYGPGYDILADYKEVKAQYLGAVWEVGYNYYLLKQRFNVGMSLSGRYYFNEFQEYNVKLCFGYNFNSFGKHKKKER